MNRCFVIHHVKNQQDRPHHLRLMIKDQSDHKVIQTKVGMVEETGMKEDMIVHRVDQVSGNMISTMTRDEEMGEILTTGDHKNQETNHIEGKYIKFRFD